MEIFKRNIVKITIALTIIYSCDTIHIFQSEDISFSARFSPEEIIHIEGVSKSYPTLNNIIISKGHNGQKGKLLMVLSSEIPRADVLNEIYNIPIDSLANESSFWNTDSIQFFVLGLLDFRIKDSIYLQLERPLIYQDNYLFAIPSISELDVNLSLGFQRLGQSYNPKIEKIRI